MKVFDFLKIKFICLISYSLTYMFNTLMYSVILHSSANFGRLKYGRFLNVLDTWQDSLDQSLAVARSLPIQDSTAQKEKTNNHALSWIRTHDLIARKLRPTPYTTLSMEVVVYLFVFRNPYVLQNFHCQIRNQWFIIYSSIKYHPGS